jgi:phage gp45-like
MFSVKIQKLKEKLENLLKIGSYTKVNGSDGNLQEIQLKTLRNIEDAMKVGQFGFNSKAPNGSRAIVAKIGNKKIVIANEHIASIIDVASGDSIVYNESGTYLKLEGNVIKTNADIEIDGISFKNHTHSQANDSDGDVQQDTGVPQ